MIEKDDFQELPYVLDHEKYFGKQLFEVGNTLSWIAQRIGLVDCDL